MKKETIGIVQKVQTDRNGDPVGAEAPDVLLGGCIIWPRASEEKEGGEVNIDGDNVACPDNAVAQSIGSEDWVRIRGELHSVDEPPARYIGKRIMLKTRRVRT